MPGAGASAHVVSCDDTYVAFGGAFRPPVAACAGSSPVLKVRKTWTAAQYAQLVNFFTRRVP